MSKEKSKKILFKNIIFIYIKVIYDKKQMCVYLYLRMYKFGLYMFILIHKKWFLLL